ncbi:2-hydroxyacid dehydrogenase [Halomonas sp. YLB-10]|uniref:2-hydroxyacid dehydrogenase n=1 Tax=unclassified Halomonas TaxID=2609666 RepID=UPI000F5DFF9B|nr:2-hydroxyacid dehydrogenase [Halomonas sp. YLB-10]RQW69521.1 2-hydroxyacid dehydrogenase [Halomonas sp. YLB-10]
MLKVGFFSSQPYERPFFSDEHHPQLSIVHFEQRLSTRTVTLCQGLDAVCVFVNDELDRTVLERLAVVGVRLVALRCAGFNNVDLDAARRLNIQVCRVPSYSPDAVAEHCVALMLTLSRKIHKAYNRVREDNFDLNGLLGFNLAGKTVGIVGFGQIGRSLAGILSGFGCRVLVTDPAPIRIPNQADIAQVEFDELLAHSDIISLHCPLTPDTHHLIDESAFSRMKDGVMLINTSRGALVDTRACIEALKRRKLGYLGLDVYEQEAGMFFEDRSDDIPLDDVFARLISFPNVVVTGHQGFFTREALSEIASTTLESLTAFEEGRSLDQHCQL